MSVKKATLIATLSAATLTGYNTTSVAEVIAAAVPQAPPVSCDITMRYWCIVQADATVNMVDAGGYRTWSITPARSKTVGVVVRENKLCDSPGKYRPRRSDESDVVDVSTRDGRNHVVTFSLTEDGVCTLRVEYATGRDDWAREGQRIAKYRLFVCSENSCRTSLLSIE
jgi:hypothetical protein